METIKTLAALVAYTGNASFAGRQAAWQGAGDHRFFVGKDGYADVRALTVEQAARLPGQLKAGGGTGIRMAWNQANLEALGYAFPGNPVETSKKTRGPSVEELLIAASK